MRLWTCRSCNCCLQSHTVLHGRPFPLKGKVFANIFVHYEPIDHTDMNRRVSEGRRGEAGPKETGTAVKTSSSVASPVNPGKELRLRINYACSGNRLAEVQNILRADPAAVNTADSNGWMPLHEAVRGGHTDLAKYLVDMGADIGAITNGGGTALWWAKRLLPPGHSTIAYLTDIGAPEESDTNVVL